MGDYQKICPRLVDYITVVGAKHFPTGKTEKKSSNVLLPQILRRYPPTDHEDFPLPLDVVFFCQPEGCTTIDSNKNAIIGNKTFVFTLTDKDSGKTRYGICVNFYKDVSKRTMKSFESDINSQSTNPFETGKIKDYLLNKTRAGNIKEKKNGKKYFALTSLCLLSHHPFFTKFRECLFAFKNMVDAFSEIVNLRKASNSKERRRDIGWTYLMGYIDSPEAPRILKEIQEIEIWIYKLLSVAAPVPGSTLVNLDILPLQNQNTLQFALPDHTRFFFVDYPLHLPIELLGIETCLKVLTLILLENKVLVVSRDYNALSMSVMSFVTLLYPLEYMFPVIPLLPTSMNCAEQLLLAPTPFVIGVPGSFISQKTKNFRLPDDIWIIDLDTTKLTAPAETYEIPILPEPEATTLKSELKQALSCLSNDALQTKGSNQVLTSVKNFGSSKELQNSENNRIDTVDLAVRVAMVRFFNSQNMLANFAEHTRTLRLYPRPVVAFQVNSFLRSRPKGSNFLNKFSRTQAIEYFAEWSLTPKNVAFLRVQTGITDPMQIGDKLKYYSQTLNPIYFDIFSDTTLMKNLVSTIENLEQTVTDESESDSDEIESTSSSFSSLSDITSDFTENPIKMQGIFMDTLSIESNEKAAFSSSTLFQVFNPPKDLVFPDGLNITRRKRSDDQIYSPQSSSSSRSNLSSPDLLRETHLDENIDKNIYTDVEYKTSTGAQKQILEKFPNFESVKDNSALGSAFNTSQESPKILSGFTSSSGSGSQDSQNSILEQITSQAKGLVRDSTWQNSQEGIFAQVDKLTLHVKKQAEEASKQAIGVSKNTFEDLTYVGKSTIGGLTRTAKEAASKNRLTKPNEQQVQSESSLIQSKNPQTTGRDFFSSIGNDLNGIASSTSNIFSDLFGSKSQAQQNQSNPVMSFDMFPVRKGLVERTPLIKHSSPKQTLEDIQRIQNQERSQSDFENQNFLSDIITQVMAGDGIGWLKVNRLRKLMEDESYRMLILNKINKTIDRKIGPEDNIIDVLIPKSVAKGMLKCVFAVSIGLEHSFSNFGIGGMASVFHMMEICHTHYWCHELSDAADMSLYPNKNISPYGSKETLSSPQSPTETTLLKSSNSMKTSIEKNLRRKFSTGEGDPHTTSAIFKDIMSQKRSSFLHKLTAFEGEVSNKHQFYSNVSTGKSSFSSGKRYTGGELIDNNTAFAMEGRRVYLFESLIGKERSGLWDQMQFWEDAFLDAVSQEREMIGMDQGPGEMMERYKMLSESERKRLEHEEDKLLSTMLFNLTAILVMLNVHKEEIKVKIRRLLGKSHIGLVYSQEVHQLVDQIKHLSGNDIDLKPFASRLQHRKTFAIHQGTDTSTPLCFMEVRDDGLLLRSLNGVIVEKWYFERLVNMTYSPKTKVICMWRKNEGQQTTLHKYYTKKCKEIYQAIKEAMERGAIPPNIPELGGEFPVQDLTTGEGGLLQVCLEGIGLLFANSKFFIRLDHIRKCFTQKGSVFILEEYNAKSKSVVQRKYLSAMADQICYSVLCVFSYVAAGRDKQNDALLSKSGSLAHSATQYDSYEIERQRNEQAQEKNQQQQKKTQLQPQQKQMQTDSARSDHKSKEEEVSNLSPKSEQNFSKITYTTQSSNETNNESNYSNISSKTSNQGKKKLNPLSINYKAYDLKRAESVNENEIRQSTRMLTRQLSANSIPPQYIPKPPPPFVIPLRRSSKSGTATQSKLNNPQV